MKILTINVRGIPSGSSYDLVSANVFQDYDAVVVNPESLDTLFGHNRIIYYNREKNILTTEVGTILSNLNNVRSEQVNGLLGRGGVVVCFMETIKEYNYEYTFEGKKQKTHISNYDWLPHNIWKLSRAIVYGKGETIDYINSGHPFSEYLNKRPSWTSYINTEDCKSWMVLASAYGTHALAIGKRVGLGHIILIPSYYHYDNGELLEKCIIKLLGDKEITSQPSWAKAIFMPGQEDLVTKITQINEQISSFEKERQSLRDTFNKLERWKYLLYEKGKHQLEPVVREALALIGCNVEPQPDKDSDGLVSCDYGTALLEIVGSKGTIRIGKLGELIKNMGNFIAEKDIQVKGILVGNPFCEDTLNNRPPKDSQKELFSKELIESAEKQSIPVLLTTDLYQIVCNILKGEISEKYKQSLQERIFTGKGLIRLIH